jgi:hypothetical protein
VIHSLLDVPKWTGYSTAFFTGLVMPDLIENIPSQIRRQTLKSGTISMDKARPHNSTPSQGCFQVSKAERWPHPAYNPEIVPSDGITLRYIKEKCLFTNARACKYP